MSDTTNVPKPVIERCITCGGIIWCYYYTLTTADFNCRCYVKSTTSDVNIKYINNERV